jgi:hypothetical protein
MGGIAVEESDPEHRVANSQKRDVRADLLDPSGILEAWCDWPTHEPARGLVHAPADADVGVVHAYRLGPDQNLPIAGPGDRTSFEL